MSAPDRDKLLKLVHDLNNVLCVISGELQLMEPTAERESLANLRLALARGAELTRELAEVAMR